MSTPIFPTKNTYRPYDPVWEGGVIGKFNAPGSYIIDDACPPIEVNDKNLSGGQILKIADGALRRDRGDGLKWGSGASTPVSPGVEMDTPVTYTVERWGEKVFEDLDASVTQGGLLRPGAMADIQVKGTLEALRINRERNFLNLLVADNTGGEVTLSGGDVWDQSGSDPFGNFADAMEYVSRTGHDADTVVIGRSVLPVLMKNAAVRAFEGHHEGRHLVGLPKIAAFLRTLYPSVDRVMVSNARYNSANPGATAVMADALSDTVVVYKRMEEGARIADTQDVAVAPGWLARVRAYDLSLDNFEDEDADGRWHRWRYAEGIAVADSAYAYGIYNCVT